MRLFLLLALLLFFGCTSKSNRLESALVNESMYIGDFSFADHALEDTTIFNECLIIPLETNDNSFIKRIDRIYKTEDHIFIFDRSSQKICVFDAQGKYQHKIHRIGQGPQEYLSIIDFCIDTDKNEIVLLCDKPYKIMRFTYSGQFVHEIKHQGLYLNIVMDADHIFCNRSELSNTDLDKYEICSMDRNGEQINNMLNTRKNITNTMFHTRNFLNRSKHIYYTRRFDNTVYQVSKDKVLEKFKLDFGQFNLPLSLLSESDMRKFSDECNKKKYIYSITEFVENEKFILFNTNQTICVYDKNNQTFIGYPRIKNTTHNIESNSFYANGNDENSIVMKLDPAMLYMVKDYVEYNDNIAALFEIIKEDDNPILFFYHFKINPA